MKFWEGVAMSEVDPTYSESPGTSASVRMTIPFEALHHGKAERILLHDINCSKNR
jgi:hypothetical protein